jgi:hypothetical protein
MEKAEKIAIIGAGLGKSILISTFAEKETEIIVFDNSPPPILFKANPPMEDLSYLIVGKKKTRKQNSNFTSKKKKRK